MEKYTEGLYEDYEENGFLKFEALAKKFPKWFSVVKKTGYGARYDALCANKTGGTMAVEIKTRGKQYEDAYIEMPKYSYLRELWFNNGVLPLYVVFYKDCTYMWNLAVTKPCNYYWGVEVSPKMGEPYRCDRFGLCFDDAVKFDLEGNIVSAPQKITKTAPPVWKDPIIFDTEITKYNCGAI